MNDNKFDDDADGKEYEGFWGQVPQSLYDARNLGKHKKYLTVDMLIFLLLILVYVHLIVTLRLDGNSLRDAISEDFANLFRLGEP